MLDYAPEDLADRSSLPCGDAWVASWDSKGVSDNDVLLKLIAATRATAISTTGLTAEDRRVLQTSFQPERMSGYCAAS